MKDELKATFQSWYANEVKKQLLFEPVDKVKIDITATAIKPLSANWIISSWQTIERRPEITINGFRKAGIVDAISALRDWTLNTVLIFSPLCRFPL